MPDPYTGRSADPDRNNSGAPALDSTPSGSNGDATAAAIPQRFRRVPDVNTTRWSGLARIVRRRASLHGRGMTLVWWGALWLVLAALLVVPVAVFLVQACSPRLFDQGTDWFTLKNVVAAFSGTSLLGLFNSLWVSS